MDPAREFRYIVGGDRRLPLLNGIELKRRVRANHSSTGIDRSFPRTWRAV